jgi:hypothetical protein
MFFKPSLYAAAALVSLMAFATAASADTALPSPVNTTAQTTGNTGSAVDADGNITFSIYPVGKSSNAGSVKLTTDGDIQLGALAGCAAGSNLTTDTTGKVICTQHAVQGQPLYVKTTGELVGASLINSYVENAIAIWNQDAGDAQFTRDTCETPTNNGKVDQFVNDAACQNALCLGYTGVPPMLAHSLAACDAPESTDPNAGCSIKKFNNNPVINLACEQTSQ